MGLFDVIIVFLLSTAILVMAEETKTTTESEIRSHFKISANETFNEYEVVDVHHNMISKGKISIKLSTFGENYTLELKPTRGLLKNNSFPPTYEMDENGKLIKISQSEVEIGKPYFDCKNDASMMLKFYGENNFLAEGYIGTDFVIRPLRSPCLDPKAKRNIKDWVVDCPHVVLKKPPQKKTPNPNLTTESATIQQIEESLKVKPAIQAVQSIGLRKGTVYVKVYCIIDYQIYSRFKKNADAVKEYFMGYWNNVLSNYALLTDFEVRISLSGFHIAKNPNQTPFLEENRRGDKLVSANSALAGLGNYISRLKLTNQLPSHDIVVAITGLDLYDVQSSDNGNLGMANLAAACQPPNNVAVLEYHEGSQGTTIATHEIAHLLGVDHDGNNEFRNYPPFVMRSGNCRGSPEYFMNPTAQVTERKVWSSCSKMAMQYFLNSDGARCLYNKPEGESSETEQSDSVPEEDSDENPKKNLPKKKGSSKKEPKLRNLYEICSELNYKYAYIELSSAEGCGKLYCCSSRKKMFEGKCAEGIPLC